MRQDERSTDSPANTNIGESERSRKKGLSWIAPRRSPVRVRLAPLPSAHLLICVSGRPPGRAPESRLGLSERRCRVRRGTDATSTTDATIRATDPPHAFSGARCGMYSGMRSSSGPARKPRRARSSLSSRREERKVEPPCASDQKFARPNQTKHACRNGRTGSVAPDQGETTIASVSKGSSRRTHGSTASCM